MAALGVIRAPRIFSRAIARELHAFSANRTFCAHLITKIGHFRAFSGIKFNFSDCTG